MPLPLLQLCSLMLRKGEDKGHEACPEGARGVPGKGTDWGYVF